MFSEVPLVSLSFLPGKWPDPTSPHAAKSLTRCSQIISFQKGKDISRVDYARGTVEGEENVNIDVKEHTSSFTFREHTFISGTASLQV
jgi:hypothetical protein